MARVKTSETKTKGTRENGAKTRAKEAQPRDTKAGDKTALKAPKGSASSADLLEKFKKPAQKLPEDRVIACRADVRVAFANVKQGVEAVFGPAGDEGRKERKAKTAAIEEALPKLSVKKVLELPDLARALMLAAQKVAPPVSTGEIEEKLRIVRELREPILATAELLAQKGLLPKDEVSKIRSGSGKYDLASDGVSLAHLFEEHAARVKGKHPFTAEEFEAMRAAGEWLVDRITPGGARRAPAKGSEAEDLRDRLFTLVAERHADLRVMGYYLFREEFDAYVPKLQSRVVGARGEGASQGEASETGETGEAGEAEAVAQPGG